MKFNGSVPRALFKPKNSSSEKSGRCSCYLAVARETEAFLHQVIDNKQRAFQRRGLAERSTVSTGHLSPGGQSINSSKESTSCAAHISSTEFFQTLPSLQVSPVVPLSFLLENCHSKSELSSTERDSVPNLAPRPLINVED